MFRESISNTIRNCQIEAVIWACEEGLRPAVCGSVPPPVGDLGRLGIHRLLGVVEAVSPHQPFQHGEWGSWSSWPRIIITAPTLPSPAPRPDARGRRRRPAWRPPRRTGEGVSVFGVERGGGCCTYRPVRRRRGSPDDHEVGKPGAVPACRGGKRRFMSSSALSWYSMAAALMMACSLHPASFPGERSQGLAGEARPGLL